MGSQLTRSHTFPFSFFTTAKITPFLLQERLVNTILQISYTFKNKTNKKHTVLTEVIYCDVCFERPVFHPGRIYNKGVRKWRHFRFDCSGPVRGDEDSYCVYSSVKKEEGLEVSMF